MQDSRKGITKEFRSGFLLALGLFAALVAVNYWPVFLGRIPLATDLILQFPPYQALQTEDAIAHRHAELGDTVMQFYPWHARMGAAIRRGVLPLWDPYLLAGRPFQANPLSALFYPFNLVFVALPAGAAWTLLLMSKVLLAAAFTFLFLKQLGATTSGSLIGGIAFGFGGCMTAWIGWPHADVALWLPLLCLCLQRLRHRPSRRMAVLTAFAFAMPVLAGHPGVAVFVLLTAAAYGLWMVPLKGYRDATRALAWLALAGFLAAGFAAVQIIPSIEWLGHINRTLGSLWPALPIGDALAFFSRDMSRNPNSAGIPIPLGAAYVGALTLLSAVLAAFHPDKRTVGFFGAALACSFGVAYGVPPFGTLSQTLPVLGGLKKEEALLVADFALAVLAGLGVSRLEGVSLTRWTGTPNVRMFGAILAATGAFYAATVLLDKSTDQAANTDWRRSPESFTFFLIVSAVLVLLRLRGVASERQWAFAATLVVAIDLVSFSHGHIPFNSPARAFPETPMHEFLSRQSQPFRTLSLNHATLPNSEAAYGLSSPAGYDFMLERLYIATYDLIADRVDGIHFTAQRSLQGNTGILDLLNVKYLIATPLNESFSLLKARPDRFREVWSEKDVSVFENLKVLPRAFLAPQSKVEVIPGDEAQQVRLRSLSFDPRRSVILGSREGLPAVSAGVDEEFSGFEAFAQDYNWTRLTVNAASPSVLVLSQMYYPGWRVYVDGKVAPFLRVNYGFAGTLVNPGRHEIEFRYLPSRFFIGAALSVVTCILSLALAANSIARLFSGRAREPHRENASPRW